MLGLSSSLEEVEEGEEVNQGELLIHVPLVSPTTIPVVGVLVVSMYLKATKDLSFPFILLVLKDEIEHYFTTINADLNSTLKMTLKPKDIGPKKGKGVVPKITLSLHSSMKSSPNSDVGLGPSL